MKVVAILRYTFLQTSNVSKVMFSRLLFCYCTVEVLLLELYCRSDCKCIFF